MIKAELCVFQFIFNTENKQTKSPTKMQHNVHLIAQTESAWERKKTIKADGTIVEKSYWFYPGVGKQTFYACFK